MSYWTEQYQFDRMMDVWENMEPLSDETQEEEEFFEEETRFDEP